MEFICELILEIVLEGFFGITVKNPRIKTRIKTVIFLIFAELIPVLMLVSGISAVRSGNTGGGAVILVLAVSVAVGFAAGAVCGHKRDWKQYHDA